MDKWLYNPGGGARWRHPPLSELVRFIGVEARVACRPVDMPTQEEKKAAPNKTQGKARKFMSSTEVKKVNIGFRDDSRAPYLLCQKQHGIKDCDTFKIMTTDERYSKVNQLGLCRFCLRRGHRWRECHSRCKCDECGR